MIDLTTEYAGLKLKNPIIIGSSSLNNDINNLKLMENEGAAAIVLKSIYEEEITKEFQQILSEVDAKGEIDQHIDYFDKKIKQDNLGEYITLIEQAKKELNIPVIASINCISLHEWMYFIKQIEQAGADAIELNIYNFPADYNSSSMDMEKKYIDTIELAKSVSNIPIIVKMSRSFTNLGVMIQKVSDTGVNGITLFNRFYVPDIDIKTKQLKAASVFTSSNDYTIPLQWVALMNGRITTDIAASTGIHDGEAFVKMLYAGASANYIVSSLFLNGFGIIKEILNYLENYLESNGYETVTEIMGLLNQSNIKNPNYYERAQFMHYFTDNSDVV